MLRSLILVGALTLAAPAFSDSSTPFDADNDGAVDLAEAQAAAGSVFDKLDGNHDGTLDFKELRGRIGIKALAAADTDNDKTVSKDEYLAYVASLFKKADVDGEGTLDTKELNSLAGRGLTKLLR